MNYVASNGLTMLQMTINYPGEINCCLKILAGTVNLSLLLLP